MLSIPLLVRFFFQEEIRCPTQFLTPPASSAPFFTPTLTKPLDFIKSNIDLQHTPLPFGIHKFSPRGCPRQPVLRPGVATPVGGECGSDPRGMSSLTKNGLFTAKLWTLSLPINHDGLGTCLLPSCCLHVTITKHCLTPFQAIMLMFCFVVAEGRS